MSKRFDLIAQQLFQKDLDQCPLEEVQLLAEKYPYFAPAQFMLYKKLQQVQASESKQQYQKAALYHHQPPLFEAFINSSEVELLPETWEEDVPVIHKERTEPLTETEPEAFDAEEPAAHVAAPVTETGQQPAPALLHQQASNDVGLTFEPYHTVDYFASQGIKLSQEETAKDNFGRQLKSFTEWLKTMKRLPAAEQVKNLDPASEKKVETMAAHSVQNTEIVTETMAEVWIKQGNLQKAIEVYNKLSLLNPSKKAYFAAKLEKLKQ